MQSQSPWQSLERRHALSSFQVQLFLQASVSARLRRVREGRIEAHDFLSPGAPRASTGSPHVVAGIVGDASVTSKAMPAEQVVFVAWRVSWLVTRQVNTPRDPETLARECANQRRATKHRYGQRTRLCRRRRHMSALDHR